MQELLRHEAMPYPGRPDFATSCASVVRDGFERDERLIILAAGEKLDDVRDELGPEAEDVTFVATDEHGRNPSRITTMLHSFQAGGDGRRSVGVIEPVVAGRSPAAQIEARFSEFVLNDPSLQAWPLSVVCLYDSTALDESALLAVQQSHPVIRGQADNPAYAPGLLASIYAGSLDPAPAQARHLAVPPADLGAMRAFVRGAAERAGVTPERVDDLVLAANEIVTNSLRHGGGDAVVLAWTADGSLVCEVSDRGFLADPLAGRLAPPPSATSGRGLWLANHLCDLVQVRSSAAGTVVRMHVDLPAGPGL